MLKPITPCFHRWASRRAVRASLRPSIDVSNQVAKSLADPRQPLGLAKEVTASRRRWHAIRASPDPFAEWMVSRKHREVDRMRVRNRIEAALVSLTGRRRWGEATRRRREERAKKHEEEGREGGEDTSERGIFVRILRRTSRSVFRLIILIYSSERNPAWPFARSMPQTITHLLHFASCSARYLR